VFVRLTLNRPESAASWLCQLLQGLVCEVENELTSLSTEVEGQRLQLIQERANGRYQARLFGIKQYTKASTKANGKRGGHLPCQSVIEDHNRIGGLQS